MYMQDQNIRSKAIILRRQGYSYNLISQRLAVAKSTLSHWLREVPYSPNTRVLYRIKAGPAKSAERRHNRKLTEILAIKQEAKKEIGKLSSRDLWFFGLGIYLGEGMKLYETIRVANSDPRVIRATIKWLETICHAKRENILLRIHLYPDNDIRRCLRYWSNETRIPLSQFSKTQFDRRKNKSARKHRILPYGTAHLTLRANGNPELGVRLHRRIIGWLEASLGTIAS